MILIVLISELVRQNAEHYSCIGTLKSGLSITSLEYEDSIKLLIIFRWRYCKAHLLMIFFCLCAKNNGQQLSD